MSIPDLIDDNSGEYTLTDHDIKPTPPPFFSVEYIEQELQLKYSSDVPIQNKQKILLTEMLYDKLSEINRALNTIEQHLLKTTTENAITLKHKLLIITVLSLILSLTVYFFTSNIYYTSLTFILCHLTLKYLKTHPPTQQNSIRRKLSQYNLTPDKIYFAQTHLTNGDFTSYKTLFPNFPHIHKIFSKYPNNPEQHIHQILQELPLKN